MSHAKGFLVVQNIRRAVHAAGLRWSQDYLSALQLRLTRMVEESIASRLAKVRVSRVYYKPPAAHPDRLGQEQKPRTDRYYWLQRKRLKVAIPIGEEPKLVRHWVTIDASDIG